MTKIIGIDLGTTNSLVSVFRDGEAEIILNALGEALTPSVVGGSRRGRGALAASDTAYRSGRDRGSLHRGRLRRLRSR